MPSTFPQRKIGDANVSAIGFGAMRLSVDNTDDDRSLAVLTRAANMGMTFWDTSDAYGPNEALIGRWFRENPGRRDEIFLATKFGIKRGGPGGPSVDGSAEYVPEALEKSLDRLGVEKIDLYYLHRVDSTTPIEITVGAMKKLVDSGKVRYLGLSECSATTLRRACAIHPIAAAQMEYSPFALDIESPQTKFLETARELGVKIVAYSPLGRGALTNTIKSRDDLDEKDARRTFPQFSEENFAKNLVFSNALAEFAREKACTPGQLSLAWLLAQGEDVIPIPGTKSVQYLEENAGGAAVQFTGEDEKRVRGIMRECGGAKGERYPEEYMKMLFGDTPEIVSV